MFYETQLNFLQKMLKKCHLQTQVIDPEQELNEAVDKGLRNLFFDNNNSGSFYDLFPEIRANTIYRVTDLFMCRYIFFQLPFCSGENIFLAGPYINADLSHQQILELGEQLNFSPKATKELELYYVSLPVIRDENYIFAMINTFAEFIWSGENNYEITDISRHASAAFVPSVSSPRTPEESMLNIQIMEQRYEYENQLIEAISQGNVHKAEGMITSFSSLAFESRVSDPLRNMKNYCIIMNTLFRKAAQQGGVHPVYLDSVSSGFAKKIENIHSISIMPDFMMEIVRVYCRLVRNHSIKGFSSPIQAAIVKIESDLTCDLSLKEMAKISNISAAYFSALFKKETGKTLTEYVNDKRISMAKHLLKNTNLQIQTVAQHCGILDLHYFCRLFKKATGKTPTEYKNLNTLS